MYEIRFSRSFLVLCVVLLVSVVIVAAFAAGYIGGNIAFQSIATPVKVEDPIEFLNFSSGLTLFPGENREFAITLQNLASINYTFTLDFKLNDSLYQTNYVTFSNTVYTIVPGEQTLTARLAVAGNAPPADLLLTVSRKTDALLTDATAPTSTQLPSSSSSPVPTLLPIVQNPSSVLLLGGGARWASPLGTKALYISWRDCYDAHHLTDGQDWGPWESEPVMDSWKAEITQALQQDGFSVTCAADMPQSLSGYDLVVIEAFWAIEPRHNSLIRNFVSNGGGVVMLGLTPCFFSVYCKDRWPYRAGQWPTGPGGTDLTSLSDWFGYQTYVNVGGGAYACSNNPFGTSVLSSDRLFYTSGVSAASVTDPGNNTQVIARYDSGAVFAFTHTFGTGRVYWQGHIVPG